MEISFRPTDPDRPGELEALVRWENDPAIRHLHVRSTDEEDAGRLATVEGLRESLERARERGRLNWSIELDGELVGEVSAEVDPPWLHGREPGSAMLGLCIGEASARGRGLGRAAMEHVEAELRARGCPRLEVGVFEFNAVARRLYASLGYREFARLPDFTWWDGRYWTDLRLEKRL